MYLKNIEVQGFKSFANKINFEFHNGITGIVGPNGSGKSNVADAVRWVLGEQRVKQLRGGSMQDVIFSGTEARKPLGYAYVAITLDNSDHKLAIDFDEVTVARKLYRSGESEYLLNGSPCRLKDVNELFYDTGIGKEGYSIIGQGQIDKILSGKPEERRELFDEAAGIVKFKKRKAFSQKKLDEEKQNLVRVNDILSELERQIGPLEKQSEKAKEYLRQKEELKKFDVNYFLLESERVTTALTDVDGKLEIATNDLQTHQEEFAGIKDQYEEIQNTIQELEKEIEETRGTLSNTSTTRTKLEGQINVLKEQINSAKNNVAHFNSRLENINKEIESKESEQKNIAESKASVDEILKGLEDVKQEVADRLAQVRAAIETIGNEIEDDKNAIIAAINDRSSIKADKSRYDAMLENVTIRRAQLNSRLLQAKTDEEKQHEIIEKLEQEFATITSELEKLNESQKDKEARLDSIKAELTAKDTLLRETQVAYHSDKTKLEQISNLAERYEGYGNSIKRVMEKKEEEKGIVGVIADIIKVEQKYETAIETALGGNINNIVTDDEATAKKMINFLKENKLGRATFLPLTSITNPQEFKQPESLSEKGVIGMACDIVDIKDEYRNVAKAMLGRIVVVDNVDNALKIARKYDYGIRMVTVDGELLAPGGAISGGAFKNNSNLLGRRREIDELTEKVKKSQNLIDDTNKAIDEIKKERNDLRFELEKIKLEQQEMFLKQNSARLNVVNAQERIDQASGDLDSLKREEEEINNQVQEIKDSQKGIDERLEASAKLEKETEEKIAKLQSELEVKRTEEEQVAEELRRQEIEVEKIVQKVDFEQQNVSRIEGELKRYTDEREEVLAAIAGNDTDVANKEHDIEEIKKTIEASYVSETEGEKRLSDMIAKKEELANNQSKFFEKREQLSDKISGLDKEVFRLNSQKEKLTDSINGLTGYMWNEYELSLRDAMALRDESMTDIVLLKRNVAEIKDKIKRLGDVNVNAIEDFKQVSERYNSLKVQHDDLVEAEKTLIGIIEQLDEAMRKQFSEKFAEISVEFDKVFKELFGGGKGTLELMEEEDILEAGIRIIAQPPGKKLQNMMQLSGGEKSLAAIALMFAIQNLKPSPFCLLDEIEAALDESNVGRFAGYLHKLTKHTQFIVITHRRGTMEKADRLYGITMQEKGVSALVSVNLIEKDLNN
ncbi:MAG: chromosome segregation protein SMC [Lachnospiraceae bacterium]|nr:chromosome segregation protein SMC [Lachnospiraceae bacterium]